MSTPSERFIRAQGQIELGNQKAHTQKVADDLHRTLLDEGSKIACDLMGDASRIDVGGIEIYPNEKLFVKGSMEHPVKGRRFKKESTDYTCELGAFVEELLYEGKALQSDSDTRAHGKEKERITETTSRLVSRLRLQRHKMDVSGYDKSLWPQESVVKELFDRPFWGEKASALVHQLKRGSNGDYKLVQKSLLHALNRFPDSSFILALKLLEDLYLTQFVEVPRTQEPVSSFQMPDLRHEVSSAPTRGMLYGNLTKAFSMHQSLEIANTVASDIVVGTKNTRRFNERIVEISREVPTTNTAFLTHIQKPYPNFAQSDSSGFRVELGDEFYEGEGKLPKISVLNEESATYCPKPVHLRSCRGRVECRGYRRIELDLTSHEGSVYALGRNMKIQAMNLNAPELVVMDELGRNDSQIEIDISGTVGAIAIGPRVTGRIHLTQEPDWKLVSIGEGSQVEITWEGMS